MLSPRCPACRATRSSPPGRARAQSLDAAAARPASDISRGCANRAQPRTVARSAGQAVKTAAARTPPPASSGGDCAVADAAQTLASPQESTTPGRNGQAGPTLTSLPHHLSRAFLETFLEAGCGDREDIEDHLHKTHRNCYFLLRNVQVIEAVLSPG